MEDKVASWVRDVESLATIVKDEPQIAYTAYCKAMQHRWVFLQRTVPDISDFFQPLENAIRHRLIPALIGREVSHVERRLFALSLRFGVLGITNPMKEADAKFRHSVTITAEIFQRGMFP